MEERRTEKVRERGGKAEKQASKIELPQTKKKKARKNKCKQEQKAKNEKEEHCDNSHALVSRNYNERKRKIDSLCLHSKNLRQIKP